MKTIIVTEEAHAALAALRRGDESLSDVISRIAKGRRSLLEFAGAWKHAPEDKMKRFVESLEAGDNLSESKKVTGRQSC
jgi:predicted CopG family antitoxin